MLNGQEAIDALDVLIQEKKEYLDAHSGMGAIPFYEFLGMIQGYELAQNVIRQLMKDDLTSFVANSKPIPLG